MISDPGCRLMRVWTVVEEEEEGDESGEELAEQE
jgi:hypothetical protein